METTTQTTATTEGTMGTETTKMHAANPRTVITYRHAYIGGTTQLCAECAENHLVIDAAPSLGPVSHGAHLGMCEGPTLTAR